MGYESVVVAGKLAIKQLIYAKQAQSKLNAIDREPIFTPVVVRIEWMSTSDPALLSFLKNRLGNLPYCIPPVY